MAGAKSGMLVASGTFCAIANCDALPTVQAKAIPSAKFFEVPMMCDVVKAFEPAVTMSSFQIRSHNFSSGILSMCANESAARRLNGRGRHLF